MRNSFRILKFSFLQRRSNKEKTTTQKANNLYEVLLTGYDVIFNCLIYVFILANKIKNNIFRIREVRSTSSILNNF